VSGISRRSVLTAAALTAVGAPAASLLGAVPALATDPAYIDAFQSMVAQDKNVRHYTGPGGDVLYRPRQLLVALADVARVLIKLRQLGYKADPAATFGGVRIVVFDREVDVPGIVLVLRDPGQWEGGRVPVVQPHHVLVGHGNIMGNPDNAPAWASPLPDPDPARLGDGRGAVIGVCDTGIWHDAARFHPLWLGGAYPVTTTAEDPLYLHDDWLALEGGHGTFVAGVLRQSAPGVEFSPQIALNPSGLGDEQMLVAALTAVTNGVTLFSLSLGGYTLGDLPPAPIANTLAGLGSDSVVVASAGNSTSDRPSWPAAFPAVVGVAAVTGAEGGFAPAPYSNYGAWVDACAVGQRASTYVKGQLVLIGTPPVVYGGFASWDGTSFAAPHVAGRVATMMTANKMTAAEAAALLLSGRGWLPGYGVLIG
jgi:hypothetical protein